MAGKYWLSLPLDTDGDAFINLKKIASEREMSVRDTARWMLGTFIERDLEN